MRPTLQQQLFEYMQRRTGGEQNAGQGQQMGSEATAPQRPATTTMDRIVQRIGEMIEADDAAARHT